MQKNISRYFIWLVLITILLLVLIIVKEIFCPHTIKTCTRGKLIALTFDDGPSAWDFENILDILKQNKVKATFFLIGHFLRKNSKLSRRAIEEGHNIASHSYSHGSLADLRSESI